MKAVLYVRVSTTEQALEGYSISAQTSILKDFAKTYNYDVIKIYSDAGISGKNIKDRPAMCDLVNDAKLKKFDIVLIWKLSRLSRNLLDLLEVVNIFNQYNISLQSYSEKFDTSTPMGKMLLQLLGSIAEFERNTIAENVKMGLNERFKQGYSKGAIPFGYKYVNKKAVVVPEQAEIVKIMFDKYINSNGNCILEITRELNANGFRTRKKQLWNRHTVKDMLRNCFYAGYVRTGFHSHGTALNANATICKGQHDAIITEDVFQKAAILIENSKRLNFTKNEHNIAAFSQLVECPLCGGKLYSYSYQGNTYINKNGISKDYLVCSYRCENKCKGDGVCKGVQVSFSKIDPFVIDALDNYVNKKLYLETAKNIKIEQTKNNEITIVENELKMQKSLKDKYFKAFEESNIDDLTPFMEKINNIYSMIQELESRRLELLQSNNIINSNNTNELLNRIDDFKTMYYNLSLTSQKELIRQLVNKVQITTDKKVRSIELTNGDIINLLS